MPDNDARSDNRADLDPAPAAPPAAHARGRVPIAFGLGAALLAGVVMTAGPAAAGAAWAPASAVNTLGAPNTTCCGTN